MLLLTNEQVRALADIDFYLEAVEECTRLIGAGKVKPATGQSVTHDIDQQDRYSLRLAPVLDLNDHCCILRITSFVQRLVDTDEGPRRVLVTGEGDTSHTKSEKYGLLFVFSLADGRPLGIVQDREIQIMRVGAVAGLGAKYLARPDSATVGLLGTGWMARPTLLTHLSVLPGIERVRAFDPDEGRCQEFAKRMGELLPGVAVEAVDDARTAVSDADVVISATNSNTPTFEARWLKEGAHVYCVSPPEYGEDLIERAQVIAWGWPDQEAILDDRQKDRNQTFMYDRSGRGAQLSRSADKIVYLSELVATGASGRRSDRDVTISVSPAGGSAGAVRFAVLLPRLLAAAVERGVGFDLPDEWFSQLGDVNE